MVAVFHVAPINHWLAVVNEQLPLLFANHTLEKVYVTFGGDATQQDTFSALLSSHNSSVPVDIRQTDLKAYEHPAMVLVDEVAATTESPILYFHTKGVSLVSPSPLLENWRKWMNRLILEADKWSEFLSVNADQYDAVGSLLYQDNNTYFAGNFWMARPQYLRTLTPYMQWVWHDVTTYSDYRHDQEVLRAALTAPSRQYAEVAVNRDERRMRPYVIDGTALNATTWMPFLQGLRP
jgi:hypothetical protein